MTKTQLVISDMHCQKCVERVTSAIKSVQGVNSQTVSVGSAEVGYEPTQISPNAIAEAVSNAGYAATVTSRKPLPQAGGCCCGGN